MAVKDGVQERLKQRIGGIDAAGKLMGHSSMGGPSKLPFMFKDWAEYRDYLLENLIKDPEWRRRMGNRFAKHDRELVPHFGDGVIRHHVYAILTNDWEFATLKQFEITSKQKLKIMGVKSGG